MSDELKQFYRDIWAWVQGGCLDHPIFNRHKALCGSLTLWSKLNAISIDKAFYLKAEQSDLLIAVGGIAYYPLNKTNVEWIQEMEKGVLYENPKRLAFIEEHAK